MQAAVLVAVVQAGTWMIRRAKSGCAATRCQAPASMPSVLRSIVCRSPRRPVLTSAPTHCPAGSLYFCTCASLSGCMAITRLSCMENGRCASACQRGYHTSGTALQARACKGVTAPAQLHCKLHMLFTASACLQLHRLPRSLCGTLPRAAP